MRSSRFFCLLVISTLILFMVGTVHSLPALAAESLSVSPTKGLIGDEIDVRGSGYDPGDRVYIHFANRKANIGNDIDTLVVWEELDRVFAGEKDTSDEGDIRTCFEVPAELNDGAEIEAVRAGKYYVYTTYTKQGKIQAIHEFTVTGITLVSPERSSVGTKISVKGVGFRGDSDITVFYDHVETVIESGDTTTRSSGDFTFSMIVPSSAIGTHTITVEVDQDEATASFDVEPSILVSNTSVMVGDRVTVTGNGFESEGQVVVTFLDDTIGVAAADEKGAFAINFDVPNVSPGTYHIVAEDDHNNSAETEFEITTNLNITPLTSQTSPGHVGMEVSISGTSFTPDTEITIIYTTSPIVVAMTTSDTAGSFSASFKVPGSEHGEHVITASDGTRTKGASFFMESTPPETPVLLLPAVDAKAQQPVRFDWDDVSDPSGVSYILQIAKDENFNTISLEKVGLVQSEYTLTQEESLASTQDDELYYWRVMAIDGASNSSNWASFRTFSVGSVFALPEWGKYILGFLAGSVVFLIALLIVRGRRKLA